MQQSHFTFELNTISQLLKAPEQDPFSDNEMLLSGESALDRLKRQLRAEALPEQISLTLLLPADQIKPDLNHKLAVAVGHFCSTKIEDNLNALRLKRFNGLRASFRGLVFLGICLFISASFGSTLFTFLPDFVRTTLGEGFNIIGWIAFWSPVESFLYGNVPVKHENDMLHLLQKADIVVQPQKENLQMIRSSM